MGFAIADQLTALGADVILIAGPTAQKSRFRNITRVDVTSAAEMQDACLRNYHESRACVMAAAVADYTPVTVSKQKIKKQEKGLIVELKKTTDILKTLGQHKS